MFPHISRLLAASAPQASRGTALKNLRSFLTRLTARTAFLRLPITLATQKRAPITQPCAPALPIILPCAQLMAQLPDVPSRLFRTPAPIHRLLSPPALALPFGLPFGFTPYSSFIFTCPCFSRTHSSFRSVYHSYPLRLNLSCAPIGLCSSGCAPAQHLRLFVMPL